MAVEIVLLCALVIILIIITFVLFPPKRSERSQYKHFVNDKLQEMNGLRRKINIKIDVYKEDLEIDKLESDYPFIEEEVNEYRRVREELTGFGRLTKPGEFLKATKPTDGNKNKANRDESNK